MKPAIPVKAPAPKTAPARTNAQPVAAQGAYASNKVFSRSNAPVQPVRGKARLSKTHVQNVTAKDAPKKKRTYKSKSPQVSIAADASAYPVKVKRGCAAAPMVIFTCSFRSSDTNSLNATARTSFAAYRSQSQKHLLAAKYKSPPSRAIPPKLKSPQARRLASNSA